MGELGGSSGLDACVPSLPVGICLLIGHGLLSPSPACLGKAAKPKVDVNSSLFACIAIFPQKESTYTALEPFNVFFKHW